MIGGIDVGQLRSLIVVPALAAINLGGEAAEELVLGTALQESGARYLHQTGRGPAVGLWEMEPATHDDIWTNFLSGHKDLTSKLRMLLIDGMPRADQMAGNLYYAAAMARIEYFRMGETRAKVPLPAPGDLTGQAAYYKTYYNTAQGAATEVQYIANWKLRVSP